MGEYRYRENVKRGMAFVLAIILGGMAFFARIPGFSGESGTCERSADNTDDSPWRYAAGTQALLYR